MKTTKHIDGYSLQYWLYAILNKEFGSEVKFKRSPLHSQYSVNRHSFTVKSNTQSLAKVKNFLVNKLKDSGYLTDNEHDTRFSKNTKRVHGKESLMVSVEQSSSMNTTDNHSLDISAFAYWKNK